MKKKILATMLVLSMVGGCLVGCGDKGNTVDGTEVEDVVTSTEEYDISNEEVEGTETTENTDTTDTTENKEEGQFGRASKAYDFKDKVSAETLTKEGWTQITSNGMTFYAPKECNTYTSDNGNSSISIVGLNEDLYNDMAEDVTLYGATDFYAICKIDASATFKNADEEDTKGKEDSTEEEEEDYRTPIKNGVFNKGETEELLPVVLNADGIETKVMLDNDDFILYQLDNSSAYLGFMYGTTDIIEIIFDPAAYGDIYSIEAEKGIKEETEESEETKDTEEGTEATEEPSMKIEKIKDRDGYLSEKYLDVYKESNPQGKVGEVVYKSGYFLDDEKEAALIMTMTKAK